MKVAKVNEGPERGRIDGIAERNAEGCMSEAALRLVMLKTCAEVKGTILSTGKIGTEAASRKIR